LSPKTKLEKYHFLTTRQPTCESATAFSDELVQNIAVIEALLAI